MILSNQISEAFKEEARRELLNAGKIIVNNYSKRREVGFDILESVKGSLKESTDVYLYAYVYRKHFEPTIPGIVRIKNSKKFGVEEILY